jgi:hypothetical protein
VDQDFLRSELEKILEITKGAEGSPVPSWWVGERAGEAMLVDDLNSGRRAWRWARADAKRGIKCLDNDDNEMAEIYLRTAQSLLLEAFASQMKPSNYKDLNKTIKKRGNKDKPEICKLAYEEFKKQEERGLIGPKARKAAKKANPLLSETYQNKTDRAFRDAINSGKIIAETEKTNDDSNRMRAEHEIHPDP